LGCPGQEPFYLIQRQLREAADGLLRFDMHEHSHGSSNTIPALRVALASTVAILLLEAGGGFLAHSLALLADAAHMLTDVAAAALGLWAAHVATRPADADRTFGYGRATVLAALANAVALILIVVFLAYEAVLRINHPASVDQNIMLLVAAAALVANLAVTWYLMRSQATSLNLKSVIAHVLGDAVISAGVIIAALTIHFTGWLTADPVTSLLAAIAVAFSAWKLVSDSLNVLMEGVPKGIALGEVRESLRIQSHVDDVHDLHVWCLSDQRLAASLHVRVSPATLSISPDIVQQVKRVLHDRFNVEHATVEVECDECPTDCNDSFPRPVLS